MQTVFLIILFIVQIIVFYVMALLYTKVSKFDDLEKKQRKLMMEMDDSIGAYLSELKDENDRLIERLSAVEVKKPTDSEPTTSMESTVEQQPTIRVTPPPRRPINLALKSYGEASSFNIVPEKVEMDDRTKALSLHDAGQSIEEIAKELGKGRTEVELILKFR